MLPDKQHLQTLDIKQIDGDDFTTIGPEKNLRWFEKLLNQRYECKHKLLGPEGEDTVRVLNRVLTWKSDGIHYEADQRHAELVVAQLKLVGESELLQ